MILQRICKGAEKRLQCRRGVHRALRAAAWRWKNRCYRCDSSRRVRLSLNSLVAIYYRWVRAGKTPEAFTLNYRSCPPKVSARLIADFIRVCGEPGIYSMLEAFETLSRRWRAGEIKRPHKFRRSAELPFSYSAFCRALSDEQRAAITILQKTSRQAVRARERYLRIFD